MSFTILRSALSAPYGAAIVAVCLLSQQGAFGAEEATPTDTRKNPITFYTEDAAAMASGGTAEQLLRRAREQGEVRVIVGLRITMRMEHALSAQDVQSQRQALRRVEDGVVARVFGSASPRVDRFDFIPYTSMFVGAAQLGRLIADPDVVSIQEDVPVPPTLQQSTQLIHANDLIAKGIAGTKRVVAILDTGVAKTHEMFAGGKVVSEACYSTNNPPNVSSLCPGAANSSTASGSGVNCPLSIAGCDHGTHVAGIAAGSSSALHGVAPGARILAIKVHSRSAAAACTPNTAPCISSFQTDQIKALQRVHALRNKYKIAAVNMSLGGGSFASSCDAQNAALKTAIDNLRAVGIATVISSGNDGFTGSIGSPACISSAIAVGNTTKTDLVEGSSNHSTLIKLMAPGTDIKSALPGNAYGAATGTSQAAPHVTGGWALMKQAKPDATVDEVLGALSCSGKTVHMRRESDGDIIELSPAMPRIDLLGAFNFLKMPPRVERNWSFGKATQARDWTPFRGRWAVSGGQYEQSPLLSFGWVGSSVRNCYSAFEVTATMTRVDPAKDFHFNSGIFFRALTNYQNDTVAGYLVMYSKCPTDSSNTCRPSSTQHPPGYATFWRMAFVNFETGDGSGTLLCEKQAKVKVDGPNTIKVVSNGSSHGYFLNGKLVCTVDDTTFAPGPLMVASFVDGKRGHAFRVDNVSIKSLETPPPAMPDVMDPAAYAPRPAPISTTPMGSRASALTQ